MTTDNKNNSGNCNSGSWNSGNWNSGNWNSGNWNSGNRNSGDWNSGYWNSGNCNSGSWNSGNRNSGDWNSGYWNSGYYNSGYCNSDIPPVRIFNKDTDTERDDLRFPNFFYFDTNNWVSESDMSEKEKEAYPSYVTCRGYLKCRTYQQAWRESWDNANVEDRKKVMALPNWNNEIFKEISGIDVEKELNIRNDIIEVTLEEIAELKGIDVSKLRIKE